MIVIPLSSLPFTYHCLAVSVPLLSHVLAFSLLLPYLQALFWNICYRLALHPVHSSARSLHSLPLSVFKWSAAHSAIHLLRAILCCLSDLNKVAFISKYLNKFSEKRRKTIVIVFFCTYAVPLKQLSLFWTRQSVWRQRVYPMMKRRRDRACPWLLLTEIIDTTRTFTTLLYPCAATVAYRLCLNECWKVGTDAGVRQRKEAVDGFILVCLICNLSRLFVTLVTHWDCACSCVPFHSSDGAFPLRIYFGPLCVTAHSSSTLSSLYSDLDLPSVFKKNVSPAFSLFSLCLYLFWSPHLCTPPPLSRRL